MFAVMFSPQEGQNRKEPDQLIRVGCVVENLAQVKGLFRVASGEAVNHGRRGFRSSPALALIFLFPGAPAAPLSFCSRSLFPKGLLAPLR